MSTLEGTASDYREHPEGSRQFVRFVDGEPVGPSTWVAEGLEFPAVFERRNNPPPPEPDARDAEIAELKAGMAALRKAGVLTDRMIADARVTAKSGR